jgi:hypothetical protein
MRQIENARWAAVEGSQEAAYFAGVSARNWAYINDRIAARTAQQGAPHGYLPLADENRHVSPWQQDYFAQVALLAASRGDQAARTFLAWAKNFMLGRFLNGPGFNPKDGVAMEVRLRDAAGAYLTTWAAVGAETVRAGQSHGTAPGAWPGVVGEYGRVALTTLAGIHFLTADPQARVAYEAFQALGYPWTTDADFATRPEYSVRLAGVTP